MDGWTDRWMDGWDGWMDGWMLVSSDTVGVLDHSNLYFPVTKATLYCTLETLKCSSVFEQVEKLRNPPG